MRINNILVSGRMYKEIEEVLHTYNMKKNFRFLAEEEVQKEDFLWADAFLSFRPTNTFDFGNLKWVHSLGAGVDSFLYKKDWKKDVMLTRTLAAFGEKIGEYCLSYILQDLQFHQTFQEMKLEKSWVPRTPQLLNEQKVLLFGTGEIGQKIAKLFSSIGIEVHGISLSGKQKKYFKTVQPISNYKTIFKEVGYIINTLPLNEDTYRMYNEAFFERLSNTVFINVGRGAAVDENALVRAIEHKNIKFAVLDVFEEEPLPKEHILWDTRNVFITPHISAITSPEEGVKCFMDTLAKIEAEEPLINVVDLGKGY